MTQFRIIVNDLQPPEIIDLHTDTEQRIVELLTKVPPDYHSLDIPRVRDFARSEPKEVSSDYVEQEASKGLETTWSAKPDHVDSIGSSGVLWMLCREMARYRVSSPRRMLHLSESDALARKDNCGHGFHLQCLLQHLDVSNTCPLCRAPNPLRTS
ncbi:hypothetical protein TNCV_4910281 [Trichonephila clavipes]|nr:hypothetical protein TNCV_4910281 [Trichonephila clavipes]